MDHRASLPVPPPHPSPLPSYWQSPAFSLPSTSLPTPPPDDIYSTVIIGTGISGTLIAHFLLQQPPLSSASTSTPPSSILLLDARAPCSGATGRNGGHTKAASYRTYPAHAATLGASEALRIARLEYDNILATHALAAQLGIACESAVCETVDAIYCGASFAAGKAGIEQLVHEADEGERTCGGMADYKVYAADAIPPSLSVRRSYSNPGIQGAAEEETLAGAFVYTAGKIHAYAFATGVLAHVVAAGVHVRANTPVHSIRRASECLPGRPLWDVHTSHGTFRARTVIVATNGYAAGLVPELQGAIVPLRGQVTAQRATKTAGVGALSRTYSFVYAGGYEYMIPRDLPGGGGGGGQHLVIGGGLGRLPDGGVSEYGTVDDGELNPEISKYLRGTLAGYFGSTCPSTPTPSSVEDAPYQVVQEWTGIMGATADGLPFVGPVPGKEGVWVSAGFNGHGMVLCLKSAEALVKMMGQGGGLEGLDWFPKSFLISEERIGKAKFGGRVDMQVPEKGQGPVGSEES